MAGFFAKLFGRRKPARAARSAPKAKPKKRVAKQIVKAKPKPAHVPKQKPRETFVVYDDNGPDYSIRELARVEAKSADSAVGRFLRANPGRSDEGVRAVTLRKWEAF